MTNRTIAAAIFFSMIAVASARAQTDQGQGGARTQELVDELKEVIKGAEQERRPVFSLTRQLKDLVRRFDWPWRVSLLFDNFSDGDYTHNPRWTVSRGEFWVARGGGLGTYFEPAASGKVRSSERGNESPALELLSDLLLGDRDRAVRETPASAQAESEIYTRIGVTNAFALKLELRSRNYGDRSHRIEFGPYQGQERSFGYRLAYESGATPSLVLLRFGPNRSSVIERSAEGVVLQEGVTHSLEWRRKPEGEMTVLLDNKVVIRIVDRAYNDPFDGFAMVNKGGEFEIQRVAISGTQQ